MKALGFAGENRTRAKASYRSTARMDKKSWPVDSTATTSATSMTRAIILTNDMDMTVIKTVKADGRILVSRATIRRRHMGAASAPSNALGAGARGV